MGYRFYMGTQMRPSPDAITELRAMSSRQAELTGEDMFSSMAPNDEEWILLCNFIPNQFTKNLF